jgi:hypothetical protein
MQDRPLAPRNSGQWVHCCVIESQRAALIGRQARDTKFAYNYAYLSRVCYCLPLNAKQVFVFEAVRRQVGANIRHNYAHLAVPLHPFVTVWWRVG